jgi:hypothetical protein
MTASERAKLEANATCDTQHLKDFLLALMNEREQRYQQRMDAADRAISKAEVAMERRLESVNEFRAQMADQQATLCRKSEVDIRFESLEKNMNATIQALERGRGQEKGIGIAWAILVAILSMLLSAAAILVSVLVKH